MTVQWSPVYFGIRLAVRVTDAPSPEPVKMPVPKLRAVA